MSHKYSTFQSFVAKHPFSDLSSEKLEPLSSFTDFADLAILRSLTEKDELCNCDCPHVLICDDDPFQAFYYQNLFQHSIDYSTLKVEKKNFRFKVYTCGEDLLDAYKEVDRCGCGSVTLIITDFSMGKDKLDGIETVRALRRIRYEEFILLRTSETPEDLTRRHKDFKALLEIKTINAYIPKDSLKVTKEVVEECLREAK